MNSITWLLIVGFQLTASKLVRDERDIQSIKDEVFQRVIIPGDDALRLDIKYQMVDYLVETTISDQLELELESTRGGRQDEDGDEEAAAEAENTQMLNGVRRILQNVFAGNLPGLIQESVSVRAPGVVQVFFADVLGSLFGSAAVKGAGTVGVARENATETALAQNQTVNPNYMQAQQGQFQFQGQFMTPQQMEQQYIQMQQYEALRKQQQQQNLQNQNQNQQNQNLNQNQNGQRVPQQAVIVGTFPALVNGAVVALTPVANAPVQQQQVQVQTQQGQAQQVQAPVSNSFNIGQAQNQYYVDDEIDDL